MSVLSHLEPKEVFYYFEEIGAIPHGSGNTKRIADYCEQFAARRGLQHSRDAHDNVIIVKEAAAGYENAAPVVLQGHLDMVCEKAPGCHKDMESEGLELAEENGWVFARGTTLGGDDGIAVAMMLALLADETLPAPRLDPETRLCPAFDSAGIALFPVARPDEMGFRVVDNFCEEHIM